jgi:hypothetical protein
LSKQHLDKLTGAGLSKNLVVAASAQEIAEILTINYKERPKKVHGEFTKQEKAKAKALKHAKKHAKLTRIALQKQAKADQKKGKNK